MGKRKANCHTMLKIAIQSLNVALSVLIICIPALGEVSSAAESTGSDTFHTVQQQLNKIKSDESAERRRVEKDEHLIQELEQQLQQLQSRDVTLSRQAQALEVSNDKLKTDTTQLQDSQ